jgi:hypothetical protein
VKSIPLLPVIALRNILYACSIDARLRINIYASSFIFSSETFICGKDKPSTILRAVQALDNATGFVTILYFAIKPPILYKL